MSFNDAELIDLEAKLSKATPGPWVKQVESETGEFGSVIARYTRGVRSADNSWVARFDDDYGTDQSSDAAYIAAANPERIAALITRLKAAEDCIQWTLDTFMSFEQTLQYMDWLTSRGEA